MLQYFNAYFHYSLILFIRYKVVLFRKDIALKVLKVFILNTIILLLSSVILQIINMFFSIYISNTIGEEAVGVFTLVMSVYMFGITLAICIFYFACIWKLFKKAGYAGWKAIIPYYNY